MYILTLESNPEGVFCIKNDAGEQIIPMFEEKDDIERYSFLLGESNDMPPLAIIEIDEDDLIDACEFKNQKYTIITSDDFIIPPKDLI
jgi:hypothetical protein